MSKVEITPELLAELKSKAEYATPGPWEYREDNAAGYNIESQNDYIVYSGTDSDCECDYGCEKESNAAYIAAANPKVVLALLDEIDRLNKLMALWRHDYEVLVDTCSKIRKEAHWLADQCATCADAASEAGVCDDGECGIDKCKFGNADYFMEAARKAVETENEHNS